MPARPAHTDIVGDRRDRAAMTAMLRGGLILSTATVPLVTLVGVLAHGSRGALGGALGAVVGSAIFALGYLAMRWALEKLPVAASMAAALAVYLLQLSWMLPAMLFATRVPGVDRAWLGAGALAATIGWMAGQVWAFMRARMPIFDVALPGAAR